MGQSKIIAAVVDALSCSSLEARKHINRLILTNIKIQNVSTTIFVQLMLSLILTFNCIHIAVAATYYNITTFSYPDSDIIITHPEGINDLGVIAGNYEVRLGVFRTPQETKSFLYQQGAFTSLDYSDNWGYKSFSITDINNVGEMVAWCRRERIEDDPRATYYYPQNICLTDGGVETVLEHPLNDPYYGIYPYGINDAGDIVGYSEGTDWIYRGFIYQNGIYTMVEYPGSELTEIRGINNVGQLLVYTDGDSITAQGEGYHIYENGDYVSLDLDIWSGYVANDINDSGQVVGKFRRNNTGLIKTSGFMYENGELSTIDVPGALNTSPEGINNSGKIVGWYHPDSENPENENFVTKGFIATPVDYDPDKNLGEACEAIGNPINTGVGNKFQKETDLAGTTRNPLEITRYYNGSASPHGAIGFNWLLNYERKITGVGNESVKVKRVDGKRLTFTLVENNWEPDADVTDQLAELQDGLGVRTGWQYTTSNDIIEEYDVDGKLISITDRVGNTQSLSYIAGILDSVTTNTGESLSFAYNANNQIITITEEFTGRQWGYRYDINHNLEYVDNPDGTSKRYHYEDPIFNHALTGITDERGIRYATFTYDGQGRAISSTHAGNADRVDIVYHADGTRTVTNSKGVDSTYTITTQLGVALVTDIIGPGCSSCGSSDAAYDYDPVNNNLLSKNNNGITVKYGNYDEKGNYQCMVEGLSVSDSSVGECAFSPSVSPDARRIDYTYDPRFRSRIETITEESVYLGGNKVTTYSYDDFGNVTAINIAGFEPDGTLISRTVTYQYSGPLNQLSQVDGPRGDIQDITMLNYYADDPLEGDNRARLRQVISNTTDTRQVTLRDNLQYSATGKLLSETRPNGLTLTYTYYPGNDQLETATESDGATSRTTRWTYLPTGEVETITTGDGTANAATLTLGYDEARRLTSVTDGFGHSITYVLDTEGNIEIQESRDDLGVLRQALTQTFDAYNRLVSRIGASSQTTTFGYDANGNLDSRTNANNVSSSFSYDSLQRLTTVSNAPGDLSSYVYDIHDNLTQVTDPNGNATTYQYDDLGNLTQLTSPDTGITTYSNYDGAGNAGQMVDANGNTTTYQHDALNRLTLATYQDGTTTQYFYDDALTNGTGRLSQIVDPNRSTSYQHNAFGDVTQLTQTIGTQMLTTLYHYSTFGQLSGIDYPSWMSVAYSYSQGRVSGIDINGQPLLNTVNYYPFGLAESWIWGNGTANSRSFNLDGQMGQYSLNGDNQSLLYDPAGNLQNRTNTLGTLTYGYDDLNRLTGVSGLQSQGFQYDANGNRTQLTDGADISSYTIDTTSNRMLSVSGAQVKTYSYDANGNITSDGTNSFVYNARNRMASANGVSYLHNGLGQRSAKQTGTGLYYGDASNDAVIDQADFDQTVGAILETATPAGNTDCNGDGQTNVVDLVCLNNLISTATPPAEIMNSTYFAYDLQGQLIGEYDTNGNPIQETVYFGNMSVVTVKNGTVYYIHTDQLNTPRAISDANNTTLWQWQSTPFGETAANEDVDNDGQGFVYHLRFPGQYFDEETGLHYNYFRDYDPSTGRYSQSDPIGLAAGLNTYGYVSGGPLGLVDPLGLATAVIINGTTSGNPVGHTAIATTGSGVFSFGNNTKMGSSLTAYLTREASRRNTDVIIINTTPEQEAEINGFLSGTEDDLPPWIFGVLPDPSDSCSTRTSDALNAGGLTDPLTLGFSFPTDVLAQAAFWQQKLGGSTISIPKRSTVVPTVLNQFNP